MNIRPVSDLRNKYPEIEDLVLREDEAVYLTKNGYGSMVVMSIEKYSNMARAYEEEKILEARFGVDNIDKALEEAEEEANDQNTKYYSEKEIEKMARGIIDG